MRLAGRYAEFRPCAEHFREECAPAPRKVSELELQARWFAGEWGTKFKTTENEEVEISQFGVWNREAGPDFCEAAVSFNGGAAIRGCIELDIDARDWERHGHATNPNYEPVVLHLFTTRGPTDFFTRTARHRRVPQVLLDLRILTEGPPNPVPLATLGRCAAPLKDFQPEKVCDILEAAAQFRLQKKAARLARMRAVHGDEALYQSLAEALGYKANKLPFTILAQRLPLRSLQKNRSQIDALLFGMSGFLSGAEFNRSDVATRAYLRGLWETWWKLRGENERLALDRAAWILHGARPANHPQRRIAALAQIVRNWRKVFELAERCDAAAARKFFGELSDPYWDFHYTLLSAESPKRLALVGSSRVADILANVFFPWSISRDAALWEKYRELPAVLSNKRVEIAAIRLFAGLPGDFLKTIARQQGLLQIYEDFCMRDNSDCEQCLFPRQLAQWN